MDIEVIESSRRLPSKKKKTKDRRMDVNSSSYLSQLSQRPRLRPNSRPQVDRVRRVRPRHHSQLAGRIIDKHAGELVTADDFLHGFAGLAVTRGVLAGVDFLQGVVGVFDEVAEEEGGWVRGWGLELRVGFEGPRGRC